MTAALLVRYEPFIAGLSDRNGAQAVRRAWEEAPRVPQRCERRTCRSVPRGGVHHCPDHLTLLGPDPVRPSSPSFSRCWTCSCAESAWPPHTGRAHRHESPEVERRPSVKLRLRRNHPCAGDAHRGLEATAGVPQRSRYPAQRRRASLPWSPRSGRSLDLGHQPTPNCYSTYRRTRSGGDVA